MITVSLIGGLGNQMFQYAAGKALAERHGVRLALDLGGFRYDDELRSFLLDRWCVPKADLAGASEASAEKPASNFVRSRWKRRIDRVLGRAGLPVLQPSANDYREPHFHYDPSFETLGSADCLVRVFPERTLFQRDRRPPPGLFPAARCA